MSKMDGLRAMREARYADAQARSGRPGVPKASAPQPRRAAADRPSEVASEEPESGPEIEAETEALCGHRAISGRTCTRETGHAAKSHRYA
jgi:hypothetical protein